MGKRIAILGSTGSIGRSTLEVVSALNGRFEIAALTGGSSWQALAEQSRTWRPEKVALTDAAASERLKAELGPDSNCQVFSGPESLEAIASDPGVDIVVSAIVGAAGVRPTLAALRAGKTVALANKEALVVAGEVMMRAARENGATLIAVDSEHSALLQATRGGTPREVRRITLTASGGPFLRATREQMEQATVESALKHPTWSMGPKITVDSATLVNKALEIIEARWLFDLQPEQITVLIHPQSIVHGLVEFVDGSLVAQLGPPDMRLPIQYALTYPERVDGNLPAADLAAIGKLEFEQPDREKFPSLDFAYRALDVGGTMPAVLNAANEVAVERFLAGEIALTQIFTVIRAAMDAHTSGPAELDEILAADRWAREFAAA